MCNKAGKETGKETGMEAGSEARNETGTLPPQSFFSRPANPEDKPQAFEG